MAEFNIRQLIATIAAAQRARVDEERRLALFKKGLKSGLPKRGAASPRRSAGRGRAGGGGKATPAILMKVHKGGLAAARYAEGKGQLLDTNLPFEPSERAAAWDRDKAHHPRVTTLFQHLSFSRPAGQPLTDAQWSLFLQEWMAEAGFDGCKYAAWRHADTAHDHIHLVISRHRPDGGLVSAAHNFWKWRAATREAERAAGIPSHAPALTRRQTEARPASDRAVSAQRRARRRGTPSAWVDPVTVRRALAVSHTPQQLKQALLRRGVELQVRLCAEGRPSGLLLRQAGSQEWLAGSSVARDFSLPRITATLQANQQALQQVQAARYATPPVRQRPTPLLPRDRGQ